MRPERLQRTERELLMRHFEMLIIACLSVGVACPAALAQQHHPDATHSHRFDNPEKWSAEFDDPERDRWQKPDQVIAALSLKPTDLVADIGAGTGYLSVRLAHHLTAGAVYAVDPEQNMVQHLTERAKANGIANLRPILATAASANLPEQVDLGILLDVYHHISNRSDYFKRFADSLKPGGRVAIIDFRTDSPVGAPKEMRVSVDQIQSEMTAAGYRLTAKHDFLPYQNFLIFQRGN